MLNLSKLHEDKRGEIYLITGDLKEHEEITLFTTNQSYARGGCIHAINDEHCIILEGKVDFTIGEEKRVYTTGEGVLIPKSTPHYFVSLTDSLVMEFGATQAEKKNKHLPTRKIVEEINRSQSE